MCDMLPMILNLMVKFLFSGEQSGERSADKSYQKDEDYETVMQPR